MSEEIRKAVFQALAEHHESTRIDREMHASHHDYIKSVIERERRRQEMIDKVKTQVIGWAVIGVIGSFLYSLGKIAHDWVRNGFIN